MAASRVRRIEFVSPLAEPGADGTSASVQVQLEDGSFSSFVVATPEQPEQRMEGERQDFSFGTPTLFVARLDEATVGEAVGAMAEDMGGYWLRYFNSLGTPAQESRDLRLPEGRKRRKARR